MRKSDTTTTKTPLGTRARRNQKASLESFKDTGKKDKKPLWGGKKKKKKKFKKV